MTTFVYLCDVRTEMAEWTAVVEDALQRSKPATMWFIEYMASSEGRTYMRSVHVHLYIPAMNLKMRNPTTTVRITPHST